MASNEYPDDYAIKSEWVTSSKLLQAAEDEDSPQPPPPGTKMPTIHECSSIVSSQPSQEPSSSITIVQGPRYTQVSRASQSHLAIPRGSQMLSSFRPSPSGIYTPSRAPSKASSGMPSQVAGTMLQGRDALPSIVAGSLLQGRDHDPQPIAPPSIAISRHSTIRAPPPKAFADTRSILATPVDVHMASCQTSFKEMTPDRQNLQEEWAQKQLDKYDTGCPQFYKWLRLDGGYQCQGGFHCVTDALLEEGKGGMMAFPKGSKTTIWGIDEWKGPYYWDEKIKRWRRST